MNLFVSAKVWAHSQWVHLKFLSFCEILQILRIFNAGIAYPDFAFGALDWAVHDQLTDSADVLGKDGDIVFDEAGKLKANH